VVDVDAVTKRFGPTVALDAVSLRVRAGELLCLAGENGSGKSTLVWTIAGVQRPDGGRILVDEREVAYRTPRDAMDDGIALVAQEPAAARSLSVAENLFLPGMRSPARRVRRSELAERAVPLLEEVGLAGLDPRTLYRSLSQPQRELVEIARAIATRPRVLILDEATTRVGDPERLFELLERRNRDDEMAVVMITHRLREIRRLARRVVVLRDGRLAGELDSAEMTDEAITALMVGRELGPHLHHGRAPHQDERLAARAIRVHPSRPPFDLSVRRGEILGVAGLAGSGRTALLRALAGLRAHGGTMRVDGEPVRGGDVRSALAAGVALVPEDRIGQGVFPSLSVSRNVALARHRGLRRARRRDEHEVTRPFVAQLAIRTASLDSPVRALSGGNQQKVVLARTLLRTPSVLLLDEPTRGIDIGGKRDVYDAIARLADEGTAIVVASSELPELLTVCDRIVVLHHGELAGVVERADFSEEAVVVLSLGGTAS